ncbi:hypothetical protein WJX84_003162 [Apatococcus fuscideae]|uniref:Uncharacterized protein n=1 Tax=Apatococcus fuscideae TaxID=2026836 RepID=A0AAW1TEG3_9CHLO
MADAAQVADAEGFVTGPSPADTTMTEAEGPAEAVAGEAPAAAVDSSAPAGEEAVKEEPTPLSPQMEALLTQFAKAKENPSDFNGWTALISAADKLGDIERVREVYDAFLAEFPLCYGYWKKYADAEARLGSLEHAAHVYERGVASIPYSIDLWGHYAMFKQNQGASHEEMQGVFERSLAYVGSDFLAHGIWDKYLRYESSHEALQNVANLYTRVLQNPIKELARYWRSLEEFAGEHDISALMGAEEQEGLRVSLEQQEQAALDARANAGASAAVSAPATKPEPAAEAVAPAAVQVKPEADAAGAADVKAEDAMEDADADVEAPPGEEPLPVIVITIEQIKAAWLSQRQQLYSSSSEELERRRSFEEAIKRPYFHIKPLDAGQLVNWMRYLDYIEQRDDHPSTIRLYERCLVPCASYPEFWARYARYLEKRDLANAQSVVQRATLVHAKRNAETHIFAAHFEERHGRIEEARSSLAHVTTSLSPSLLSAAVAHASFEKRQGNQRAAQEVLKKAVDREEEAGESGQHALALVHYINFMQHAFGEVEEGRAAYAAALEKHPSSKTLWEGAIRFEENLRAPDTVTRVLALYDKATTPPADSSTKALPVPDQLATRFSS